MKNKNKGWLRLMYATRYSMQGLRFSWQNEAAFRQECILSAILIPLALYLDVSILEKALLISSCLLIIIIELINSALEAIVDRIGAEYNELSGAAKDIGSAAVLVSILVATILWLAVVYGRYFN